MDWGNGIVVGLYGVIAYLIGIVYGRITLARSVRRVIYETGERADHEHGYVRYLRCRECRATTDLPIRRNRTYHHANCPIGRLGL